MAFTTPGEIVYLYVGNDKIAECETSILKLPNIKNTPYKHLMEFYYRRGSRYYFRSHVGKIVVDSLSFKDKLKKGKYYCMEYGY